MTTLFSEISVKNISVKNRIVMPPVICFKWSDETGFITEKHLMHYEAIAKGGAGLIILEAHCVNKNGRLSNDQLGLWSDDHIEGLRCTADVCHKYGAVVLVQLHHAGINTPKTVSEEIVAPSKFNKGGRVAKELTVEEMYEIQQDFVDAAKRAMEAGLDGIEIQGAQGYLISQFLSPIVNKRDDSYGGDISNRTRFACEIIYKIKKELGDNLILGYRLGGNEPTLEDGINIAKTIEKSGADLLHISFGMPGSDFPEVPDDFPYSWLVHCGSQIKKHVNIPVIAVGDIKKPEQASDLIENNLVDFAAVGKGQLVDPEWANKAKNNLEIIPCLKCPRCSWYKDGRECPGVN